MGNSSLVRSSIDIGIKGKINNTPSFKSSSGTTLIESNHNSSNANIGGGSSDLKLYQKLNDEEFEKVAQVLRKSLMDGIVTLPGDLTRSDYRPMEASSSPPNHFITTSSTSSIDQSKTRNNSLNVHSFRSSTRNTRLKDIKGTFFSESILIKSSNNSQFNNSSSSHSKIVSLQHDQHDDEMDAMKRFKLPPISPAHPFSERDNNNNNNQTAITSFESLIDETHHGGGGNSQPSQFEFDNNINHTISTPVGSSTSSESSLDQHHHVNTSIELQQDKTNLSTPNQDSAIKSQSESTTNNSTLTHQSSNEELEVFICPSHDAHHLHNQ
ncbi:hypothetical protein NAEGRDRAFT_45408 [Naegleria gruberi]|uniref:Uncharacterized protein n=1 Tax=Naegleria gruberi TaxID=5762 RepID=D2UZ75_NAEGR|nr:uncharacterized protein NAEGRDRAFT_45408 [Naegleria gruberi]EFC49895.1 hypothetical protein NAEGRDRAFT_45408 [Naegleria gruberi]|eukprot:XP_002682639.1 hypothetical protein NAEGRDRAFT_45408 [Naegleria gruberi strain NEG-M]